MSLHPLTWKELLQSLDRDWPLMLLSLTVLGVYLSSSVCTQDCLRSCQTPALSNQQLQTHKWKSLDNGVSGFIEYNPSDSSWGSLAFLRENIPNYKHKHLILIDYICRRTIAYNFYRLDAMIFVFWMLHFKPNFSLSSFTFIKGLFSSSLSAKVWCHLHIWGCYFSQKS